jgi:hypothetical protein
LEQDGGWGDLGTMAYTPLHHNLNGMARMAVLTVQAFGAAEGVGVEGENLHSYEKMILGRS